VEIATVTGEGIEFTVCCHTRPPEVLEVMMPRCIQDILDHASELAKRFEDYEPSPDDEIAVAEHLLRRAALA
jgi:hypothetical protein